ncbi:MAG: ABC transporter ATP-binding protein [Actinomycetota bacterium]|jgi:ABC-2 type transport system ATP-binding protein|nr:ABC transporter ATP-binding protein [Actinomycetota bacterium]
MTDPGEAFVVDHLTVRYGSLTAVDDVSLTVATGETFGLVGPNGAGKTSLVECLSGLRAPSAGRVLACGVDPRRDRGRAAAVVGVQLQDANFPRRIRVDEACHLFGSFYRDPAPSDELLEMFDLSDKRRAPVRRLSGGQRQRLSLVLALIGRPRALVLDELTTGLDPQVRRSTWGLIRSLAEQGLSIVLTSHSMDEIEALCDRVALLRRGRIEACGTVGELVRRYGNLHRYVLDGSAAGLVGLDELAALAPVASVDRVGAQVSVRGPSPETGEAVAKLLASRGGDPSDVRHYAPSFEDIFVSIVSDEAGEAPA